MSSYPPFLGQYSGGGITFANPIFPAPCSSITLLGTHTTAPHRTTPHHKKSTTSVACVVRWRLVAACPSRMLSPVTLCAEEAASRRHPSSPSRATRSDLVNTTPWSRLDLDTGLRQCQPTTTEPHHPSPTGPRSPTQPNPAQHTKAGLGDAHTPTHTVCTHEQGTRVYVQAHTNAHRSRGL
jgi:hypothetical protein